MPMSLRNVRTSSMISPVRVSRRLKSHEEPPCACRNLMNARTANA